MRAEPTTAPGGHGSAARFTRLERAFDELARLDEAPREAELHRRATDDPTLCAELAELFAAGAEAGSFLEPPSASAAVAPADGEPPMAGAGWRIGPYRLEGRLGAGGMSTVYLARHEAEPGRPVALKVLARELSRRDLAERFEAEARILAILEHPAIARLLGAGVAEDGRPYLVIELLEGLSIDRYCDDHGLGLERRLELFLEVCAAVSFAHRHLIVHRDLKPSNILVTADGRPKLLDFGIAKLLHGSPVLGLEAPTGTGQGLMTPLYASPEQFRGEPIGIASDVYSLGVLLAVLLAGRPPYVLDGTSAAELERAVVAREPVPPSARVDDAARRRRLEGDLDNIVLFALRKAPEARYRSVDHLADDLRRHLHGRPVLARRPTPTYRLGKFVGRHRAAVALSTAAVVAVLAFATTVALQAVSLRRERDWALRSTRLLDGLLGELAVLQGQGRESEVLVILDEQARRIEDELAGQPEALAALSLTLGKSYARIARLGQARLLLERSLALRRRLHGEASLGVAESLEELAFVDLNAGNLEAAEASQRRALAIRRQLEGVGAPAPAASLNQLGMILIKRARYDEARAVLERALAGLRSSAGDEPLTASVLSNLGTLALRTDRLEEAGRWYEESVALWRRLGREDPTMVTTWTHLVNVRERRADPAGGAAAFAEGLRIARRFYDAEHPLVARLLASRALELWRGGRAAEAEPLCREALTLQRKRLGADNDQVGSSLTLLGAILRARGQLPEAEEALREALATQTRVLGPEHPRTADALLELARVRNHRGAGGEALDLTRRALEIRRRVLGTRHADTLEAATLVDDLSARDRAGRRGR